MQIRLATGADSAAVAEIYRPAVLSTPASFEFEPPDDAEMRRRIEATLPGLPWLVCEHQGDLVGYAYAGHHRARAAYQWSVDTSVYVHTDFHRMGIGKGLYASLFAILAAQGFCNAYAGITLPNPGSVGLHETAGFQLVGVYRNVGYKFGRWHDVGWWQMALRPPVEIPLPVRKLDELPHDALLQMLMAGCGLVRES